MCLGKLTCHWARAEEKARQVNLPLVLKGLTRGDNPVFATGSKPEDDTPKDRDHRNVLFSSKLKF